MILDTRRLKRLTQALSRGEVGHALAQPLAERTQGVMLDSFGGLVPPDRSRRSRPGEPPFVETGTLAQSIRVVRVGAGGYQVVVHAPYARYLEFGTARMAARPFVRPAADQVNAAEVVPVLRAQLARFAGRSW